MTLEEKVGQLFMTYFDGEHLNSHAERLIREAKIGGILYFNWANGLEGPSQVQDLSAELQNLAHELNGIPLFIAVDQEGGSVARLRSGFTKSPGNGALGKLEPHHTYEVCYVMGKEMRAVGINLNLAPVIDLKKESTHSVISDRCFGADPQTVTERGRKSVQGFLDAGIIPCLKHFPGYGGACADPHLGLQRVDKSYSEMEEEDLYPFRMLAAEAPMIMTAHIFLPQIDPDTCATLSSNVLQGILREKLRFEGVLITDSLTMKGVLDWEESLEAATLKAFAAGNDILIIGERVPPDQVNAASHIEEVIGLHQMLVTQVKEGLISEERVNASVRRILELKKRGGLVKLKTFNHREVARRP